MVKETVERCSINDHDIVVSCIKGCIISRLYSSGEMEYLYCSNLRDFFLFYCPEWKFSFFGRYCGQRSYSKFLHLKSCDVFIQFCNLNKYFFFKFYLMYSLMGASLQIFGESESKKLVSEWDELLIKFKNWMLSYMYLLSLNSRPTIFFSLLECPYENLNWQKKPLESFLSQNNHKNTRTIDWRINNKRCSENDLCVDIETNILHFKSDKKYTMLKWHVYEEVSAICHRKANKCRRLNDGTLVEI